MTKMRLALVAFLIALLFAATLPPAPAEAATKTVYVGGSMALTGAYSQDVAAILAAFEDYVRYVNETKLVAPWRTEKFPADVTLELLWRDDELKPAKDLTIYEELKAKGMVVFRVSGSPQALALKDRLNQDGMGATSMSSGAFLLTPPQTIFTHYPIYTDNLAAIADWYLEKWKENRKPRVAYLTADNAMGKSVEVPEMDEYLKKVGYELVGSQYVPLVPIAPPTTQLMWLKEKKVDLALGVMINPGSQPTVKEMVRLGMGPHLQYKMTLGVPSTAQIADFAPAMGELGNGYVSPSSLPPWDDLDTPGVKFCNDVQAKYRPGKKVTNITYELGMIEVMTQVEALRLALKEAPADKLKPADVLKNGFYKIKNLDTGGLTSTLLNYGPGKVEGVDAVRIYQVQKGGKIVKLGNWPCRHIYGK
jgi:ABC-type branched-subunit amino acid transport system substrate-binding protein